MVIRGRSAVAEEVVVYGRDGLLPRLGRVGVTSGLEGGIVSRGRTGALDDSETGVHATPSGQMTTGTGYFGC